MKFSFLKWAVLPLSVVLSAGYLSAKTPDEDLLKKARELFKPIPEKIDKIPNKNVKLTKELVELGKYLYFDPRLSASHLISCNSCHNVMLGGTDNVETSIGHGWQKGPRNAPTVFNAVYHTAQFWDGRAKDLMEQAKGPIQAAVEMNNTPERVIATLKSIPKYVEMFKKAFPGEKEPVTFDNVAKAIEAFEATLLTPNSKFDRFLKGDTKVLTKEEKEGLKLFIDKGCASCHSGITLGGHMYAPFGMATKPNPDLAAGDRGRFEVTKSPTDDYVFKVPSLRNIELTYPYFHSGKVWNLEDAIVVMGTLQYGITLTDAETKKIAAFLRTLTGDRPKVVAPLLPPNTDKTPKPITK
ncbi:MAG: cytochrome-c peroxidase [Caldimicrobium sp.]|nr:cytochrome-c peroxidase [Caldimicrobium sp.]MCX7613783.1 cytochrome-c peroxidase [Caldimicrobium sp.]MDW8182610.1 cytochrome-c peroxidase [Caldimicrobium sp.]